MSDRRGVSGLRIAIVASGTRGDVQPYIALGQGLKQAGHHVRVLTSDDFAGLVTGAGLEFCATGISVEQMIQSEAWRKTMESGNFLRVVSHMNAEMQRRARDLVATTPALLEGADLIVAGLSVMMGTFSIAEKLDIPVIQAYVVPLTPTRAFPGPLTPRLPLAGSAVGGALNALSFHVMRQMLWQSGRVADVVTRRHLGLRPASVWGPYRILKQRRIPILYGYSQHVVPRPADWDEQNHITGYWFLDAPLDWSPPPALSAFLEAGEPPVYIGFGSMGNRHPEATSRLVLKALDLVGCRGVLASGWGGLAQTDLPERVFMLSSAPHDWLFPRMAAVVHHGGAGTTAAGLRSGLPTAVVPFFGDQMFWGQRVAELGIGPAFIPRRQLTAERLADAISSTLTDAAMRQRAAALGDKIRTEQGVAQAVKLITDYNRRLV